MEKAINGKALKTAIQAVGLTVEEFAQAIGVSRREAYFYIEEERTPKLEVLVRIADTLKLKNVDAVLAVRKKE